MSDKNSNQVNHSYSRSTKLKFLVVSAIGICLFFVPFNIGGFEGVGIGILSDALKAAVKPWKTWIVFGVIIFSCIATVLTKIFKPDFIVKNEELSKIYNCGTLDVILRVLAAMIAFMTVYQVGPQVVWDTTTGQEMYGLIFTIVIVFVFSSFLLPTLLDFGLMDFFGTLCTKFMRRLFTLPGRAALDTLASWVGSGSVGVVITDEAYVKGGYTRREAAIVMTMFSVTSITYGIFMADYVGLPGYFLHFYATCLFCGVVCAMVIPRVRPLSKFEDTYYGGAQTAFDEIRPENYSLLQWAYEKGIKTADKAGSLGYYVKKGFISLMNYWFNLMPVVLTVGTIGLILVNFTPIFDWIGYPFRLLLELFRIPEATSAAPAMITGFIDFFIPLPIANQISSLSARFVILCMSFVQVIYLTQVGALMMKSKVKISLMQLLVIFLERTIISLPIVCVVAHLLF